MLNELVIIHRRGSNGFQLSKLATETPAHDQASQTVVPSAKSSEAKSKCPFLNHFGEWLQFDTCMRKMIIGEAGDLEKIKSISRESDDVFRGHDAYRFLLQVICGLHSPLVGETEVYGQFKNTVASYTVPETPWGTQIQKVVQALFEDAKKIRQTYLVDLGSQSYGSILRRELKGLKNIHILGAGHLVQEVLPWLCKDERTVHVHCRNPQKGTESLSEAFEKTEDGRVFVHDLRDRFELENAEALIVAAPVSSDWLKNWLPSSISLQVTADLRGNSDEDRIDFSSESRFLRSVCKEQKILTLSELLTRIESNQAHIGAMKKAALDAVDEAVEERNRHVEYRPFGWEDVCA